MVDNFPYEDYLNDYQDLKHLNKEKAYKHWLEFGIKEGRKLKNYDYEEYLEYNLDLRHLNKEEAYKHWLEIGIKEGRIAKTNNFNTITNIVIVIHLFNCELFDEFINYINNVKSVFSKVAVIFTIPVNSNFDKNIKSINPEFIILKVENKGVDVYAFLLSMQFLRKNNIKADFILKLHTKMTSNDVEELFNWRNELIEPITNIQNLKYLQHYFKNVENLGYVASQKSALPKNFDLDFPSNIEGLNQLIEKFPYLPKDWTDFNGGNIFWINNTVLDNYLKDDLIKYIIENVSHGKPPCNLTNKGIYVEYLCERLLTGVLCYNSTNILVSDYKGTKRGIGNDYFYQPKIFSFNKPKEIIKYISNNNKKI
jgi:hypothetical protein